MTRAVSLDGVVKAYGDVRVLDGVSLSIPRGQLVALLGPSGTGKTTLLRLLAGFERPDSGEIAVVEPRTIVYQEPRLIEGRRVLRNVLLGQRRDGAAVERARSVLAEVGLAGKERAWPTTLAGGEAQRVALARALSHEPRLLLADEPFAALDALTRLKMHALVDALRVRHDPAIVLVTHDVDEAVRLADRVVLLREGAVAIDEVVPISHPRSSDDPALAALRERLLVALGVEVRRTTLA